MFKNEPVKLTHLFIKHPGRNDETNAIMAY